MKAAEWLAPDAYDQWDRFAMDHPHGCLCHTTLWQGVLQKSFRHIRGRYCVLRDHTSGAIVAGLPIYEVNSWLLGRRLVSVPFATLCDPLISSPKDMEYLLPLVTALSKRIGARYAEFRTFRAAALVQTPHLRASHSYKHHFVRLDRPLEDIRMTFGRTAVRQMISKAERAGLQIGSSSTEDAVYLFHRLLSKSRRHLALPPIPLRFFISLWGSLSCANHMDILLAQHEGKTVGAILALKWKNIYAIEYVGDDRQFRNQGLVQLMYWESMKLALSEGYEYFSFGRTYRGNQGLVMSKAHWGTEVEDLCTYFYPETTHRDAEDREASWQYSISKKLARHAPQPMFKWLGDFCYRHMG